MPKGCVLPVHNLRVGLGTAGWFMNTVPIITAQDVENQSENALTFTQLSTNLCTSFQHLLHTFSSVSGVVVHRIHRPYKEYDKVKKG